MSTYNISNIMTGVSKNEADRLIGKTAYLWSYNMYEGLVMSNMGIGKRIITDISFSGEERFVSNGECFRYAILAKPETPKVGDGYARMYGIDFIDLSIVRNPEEGRKYIGQYVMLGEGDGGVNDIEWDSPTILTDIDPSSPTMFKGKSRFDVGNCMLPMGDWLPENKVILEYQPYDFRSTEDLKDFLERAEDRHIRRRSDGSDCVLCGVREELRYMERHGMDSPLNDLSRDSIYTSMLRIVNPHALMVGYVFADGTPCGKR